MVPAAVPQLRRFNRLLTQRIGLVDERYLGTGLSFAHARLLYELASLAPLASHHLRRLIALDAASMSRGLTALATSRYVRRTIDPSDARKRILDLTPRGRGVLEQLDQRSDARVGGLVAGLPPADGKRLSEMLDLARRLLMKSMVRIEARSARDADVRAAQAAYLGEIARRFGRPLDPWNQGTIHALVSLVVMEGRRPIGCGALRELSPGVGEIKRMWLHPDARGIGLGARLLGELEEAARRKGHREIRLDTNARLGEAMSLYEAAGYRPTARYNDNPDATNFYVKTLRRTSGARSKA
jgi:DNA-binding MarR family transcriptional regulator/ribosomal protein S18 acetylase RimI-like enzyme